MKVVVVVDVVGINLHNQPQLRASTVKWTTPDPYIGLSESDSKPYTKLNFVKKKIMNT